jgi:Zn finger protein HypA/HybF involved in hydrogenase expression
MSLKRIVYRGGRYARHRDRIQYDTYSLTPEEEARTNAQMAGCCWGCLGVFLIFIFLGLCIQSIQAYAEGIVSGGFVLVILLFSIGILGCFAAYAQTRKRPMKAHDSQPAAPSQVDCPQAGQPAEADYLNCHCQHCNQRMEFPRHGVGMTINCPTCGLTTVLYDANGEG